MIYGTCLGGKVERCVGGIKLGRGNTGGWRVVNPWTRGKEWYNNGEIDGVGEEYVGENMSGLNEGTWWLYFCILY